MSEWEDKTFEINRQPKEGDKVQFVALHILGLEKLRGSYDIPQFVLDDLVCFYLREKD